MPPPETPDSEYFKSREKKSKLKIPPETVMLPTLLASARPFMLPCHREISSNYSAFMDALIWHLEASGHSSKVRID